MLKEGKKTLYQVDYYERDTGHELLDVILQDGETDEIFFKQRITVSNNYGRPIFNITKQEKNSRYLDPYELAEKVIEDKKKSIPELQGEIQALVDEFAEIYKKVRDKRRILIDKIDKNSVIKTGNWPYLFQISSIREDSCLRLENKTTCWHLKNPDYMPEDVIITEEKFSEKDYGG